MTITLRVLHGADRGKVYSDLKPPITIGREEGNVIHLNDERASRYHLKIQVENDRIVLTDLNSTNGTKVNGVSCQLKILRHGDLIAVGRSLLLLGTDAEISAKLFSVEPDSDSGAGFDVRSIECRSPLQERPNAILDKPGIPEGLSLSQKVQFSEVLEFMRTSLHRLIESADADDENQKVNLKFSSWQNLLLTQAHLGELCSQISRIAPAAKEMRGLDGHAQDGHVDASKVGVSLDNGTSIANPLFSRVKQISNALKTRKNVRCRGGRQLDEIQQRIEDRDPECIRILGEGFDRVFIFSGKLGANDLGDFELVRFQQHLFEEIALQLGLGDSPYRLAELPQFLKSKGSSDLYCFLSAEHIPKAGMECLRGLGFFSHNSSSIYFGENEQLNEWTGVELEV